MDEYTEKKIIAFTSQSLRHYGIRAVRMDDIAKNMNISKRTIYQVYTTKDNLVNSCLKSYVSRIENICQLIRCNHEDSLVRLWKISKAYIENLYRGECAFWIDVNRLSEYKYIYITYNRIWSAELDKSIMACQKEKYIIENLDRQAFLELFTTLLYNARLTGCLLAMLHNSAYLLLRGIMREEALNRPNVKALVREAGVYGKLGDNSFS